MKKINLLAASMMTASLFAFAPMAQAETVLPFASWQFEEPGNSDWWRAVIGAFEEENPDITIEEVYIPYADYLTQMTIRFASNRPPAVIQLSEQLFGAYAAQGWLAGLDGHIEGTDIATDWASAQDNLTWDDETRGVIVSNSVMMMFYNSEVLANAGVDVPDSWEAYREAVAAITDRDAGVFGLSAVTTEHPTAVEELHRYTLWAGTALIANGAYNLTSPEVIDAIDEYRETVGNNAPLGNNSSVARQLFVDGKTGILLDGSWVWSWLERATPEMRPKLNMIKAPFDKQLVPGGLTIHIAEGLDEATEDAAWKFIQFTTRQEWQREYLKVTGQPAGRAASVLTDEDIAAAPHLAVIADAAKDGVPMFSPNQQVRANFAEYSAILMQASLRLLSTQDDTVEILTDAQEELESTIPLN